MVWIHLFGAMTPSVTVLILICMMTWIAHADAERKKFRDQFLNSEQELAAAKGREEALQDQLLKEVNASQERLRKQLQLYSELEVLDVLLYPIICIVFPSFMSHSWDESVGSRWFVSCFYADVRVHCNLFGLICKTNLNIRKYFW